MLGEEEEGEGMRGWRRRMIQSGMREGGEGSDETEERMGLRPWIRRELRSFHFHFPFISPCMSGHSAWMRCQNLALQPDGIDQLCNSDTIWRDLVVWGG